MIKGGRNLENNTACSKIIVRSRAGESINDKVIQFEIQNDEAITLRSFNGIWWTIHKTLWDVI